MPNASGIDNQPDLAWGYAKSGSYFYHARFEYTGHYNDGSKWMASFAWPTMSGYTGGPGMSFWNYK